MSDSAHTSGGTAMGVGVTGTSLVGVAQFLSEPYKTVLTLGTPAMTAAFVWFWPRIMMGIEAWSDLRDVKRTEEYVNSLKLDAASRDKAMASLANIKAGLAAKMMERLAARNKSTRTPRKALARAKDIPSAIAPIPIEQSEG